MDLLLVYINLVGKTWDDFYIYEFMFNDVLEDVDGENWDTYPASGLPLPPINYVKNVKILKTELEIKLIQNSDTFSVWDAVDKVIALGWEETKDYELYPDYRISFIFGESLEKVNNKLFQKELEWSREKDIINEH